MNRDILMNLLVESGFKTMNFTPENLQKYDTFATKVARYVVYECAQFADERQSWVCGDDLTQEMIQRLDKSSEKSNT